MAVASEGPLPVASDAEIGARARGCIAASGYTQRAFAEAIDLDATKLSKSLSGRRRFTADELKAIAATADVTVHWLLTGVEGSESGSAVAPPAAMPRRIRETPQKQRRRREVLAVAWRLFAEGGYPGVGLSEIADAAGVSPSMIAYYFGSKRELLDECLRVSVKDAYDRQTADFGTLGHARDRLLHLLTIQAPDADEQMRLEWSIWLQVWAVSITDPRSRESHADAYRRWTATVANVLRECQNVGVVQDRPLDDLVGELTALFDGLGLQMLMGTIDAATLHRRVRAYLEHAVLVPGTESTTPSDR